LYVIEPLLTYTYPAPPKEVSEIGGEAQIEPTTITYYPFPSPDRLAKPDVEEKLRELSFGYRSRYLSETASMLVNMVSGRVKEEDNSTFQHKGVNEYLHSLRDMTYNQARSELLQFPGIGPKVAE
jgi:N-glycosylase/DNA lyase